MDSIARLAQVSSQSIDGAAAGMVFYQDLQRILG